MVHTKSRFLTLSMCSEVHGTRDLSKKSNDKASLETEKLKLEIDGLRENTKLEKRKVYGGLLTVIVALLVGGIDASTKIQNFLAQREASHKFEVNNIMVSLLEKLHDRSMENNQRTAALALSLFGEPAIDVLVESLRMNHKHTVNKSITDALKNIAKRNNLYKEVVNALDLSILSSFRNALTKKDPGLRTFKPTIIAMKSFGKYLKSGLNVGIPEDQNRKRKALKLLKEKFLVYKQEIEKSDALNSGINEAANKKVITYIEDAINM